jgi:hypothetical protein
MDESIHDGIIINWHIHILGRHKSFSNTITVSPCGKQASYIVKSYLHTVASSHTAMTDVPSGLNAVCRTGLWHLR